MSNLAKDDPNKPYKAYAGAVAALLSTLVTQYADSIPPVGKMIISIVIAAIAVYVTPNPKKAVMGEPIHRNNAGYTNGNTILFVFAIIGIVLLVLLLVGGVNIH